MLAVPGNYSAQLYQQLDGEITALGESQSFAVKQLRTGALEGAPLEEVAAFWRSFEKTSGASSALAIRMNDTRRYADRLAKGLLATPALELSQHERFAEMQQELAAIETEYGGNPLKAGPGEKNNPTIGDRLFAVMRGVERSTYGPTSMHRSSLQLANEMIADLNTRLDSWRREAAKIGQAIQAAGGPWVQE